MIMHHISITTRTLNVKLNSLGGILSYYNAHLFRIINMFRVDLFVDGYKEIKLRINDREMKQSLKDMNSLFDYFWPQ